MEGYITLAGEAEAAVTEKKSVFTAYVSPVTCEQGALSFIESVRKRNAGAGHYVYAYRAGKASVTEKFTDDGEPSGTAGLPVLSMLRKEGLDNVVVVITRFFGGILLGAGGLVRAYQAAAKAGIDAAGIAEMRPAQVFAVTVAYTFSGKIIFEAQANKFLITETKYAENVGFTVQTPFDNSERFTRYITDLTSGSAVIEKKEIIFTGHGF